MNLFVTRIDTPLGEVVAASSDRGVAGLGFADGFERVERTLARRFGAVTYVTKPDRKLAAAIRRYFAGDLAALDDVALDTDGTAFQRSVWKQLRRIPVGRTTSYGKLAATLGRPGGSRAVGNANGGNPVSLIVPCHRVIAADGTLGGYAFGLERKRWLLEHEGVECG